MYVLLFHTDYLSKICTEKGNSFEGLKYRGGPHTSCPKCEWAGVIPFVQYPSESGNHSLADSKVSCEVCYKHKFDVNLLLDPEVYLYARMYSPCQCMLLHSVMHF